MEHPGALREKRKCRQFFLNQGFVAEQEKLAVWTSFERQGSASDGDGGAKIASHRVKRDPNPLGHGCFQLPSAAAFALEAPADAGEARSGGDRAFVGQLLVGVNASIFRARDLPSGPRQRKNIRCPPVAMVSRRRLLH
jgi:hypothetical protein